MLDVVTVGFARISERHAILPLPVDVCHVLITCSATYLLGWLNPGPGRRWTTPELVSSGRGVDLSNPYRFVVGVDKKKW